MRYTTMHSRVVAARGAASLHACAHCPAQAAEWSYTGGGLDELVELRRPFGGPARPVRYSTNPSDYIALCRSCHRRLDGEAPSYSRTSIVDLRKPRERTGQRLRCTACEMTKDAGAFSLDRRSKTGRQCRCRACNARYQVEQKARRRSARESDQRGAA